MKLRYFIFSAFLCGVFLSCNKKQDQQQEVVPAYPVMDITKQNAEMLSTYSANVKGEEDIQIKPRVDGEIKSVLVEEGQVVTKGQALFVIDSPQSEQAYRTAKAAVASAEAQVQTALINVNRLQPLAQEGIVSDVQYKTAVNSYDVAVATLEQAKASLYNASEVKGWTTVTSPVDGAVNNIPYRQGSLVNTSTVLTTIANTKGVYVYFSIDESYLMSFLSQLSGNTQAEKINNIDSVTLILKDGSVYGYKGKVKTIDGIVNSTTGTVMLRADFPNPNRLLKSGFSGTVTIPRYLENVIVIPQKSTYSLQNKVFAYKFVDNSVTLSTIIDVIPTPDGQSYVVTNGLQVGDKIVSDGLATLKDNMKIKAK